MNNPFHFNHKTVDEWPDVWEADNGLISLTIVPAIGGRILQFGLPEQHLFWNNRQLLGRYFPYADRLGNGSQADWKNYGGEKVWVAPQGRHDDLAWPGPPDPVLDSGHYRLRLINRLEREMRIGLSSPADEEKTGLRIDKEIRLQPNCSQVQLAFSFHNIVEWPIEWSIWENIQLNCESNQTDWNHRIVVTMPINPASRFNEGFTVLYGRRDRSQWRPDIVRRLLSVHYQNRVGKIGMDGRTGWAAYYNGESGDTFVVAYDEPFAGSAIFPDNGCSCECWTNGVGMVDGVDWGKNGYHYLETEVLGPMQKILPGKRIDFTVKWAACRSAGPVLEVSAAGCVVQPLAVDEASHSIIGSFGVFYRGFAFLLIESAGKNDWTCLGPTSPKEPLAVNYQCDGLFMRNLAKMTLLIRDFSGNYRILNQVERVNHNAEK